MDSSESEYQAKYLKYKAKYLQLKEIEEKMGGGVTSMLASAKASASAAMDAAKKTAQSVTGTTPQDGFNGKVLKLLDQQIDAVNGKVNTLLASLESSQQKEIKSSYEKEFGNSMVFGTGPVAKAIKAIKDVLDADGKELRKTTPEAEFKVVMQKLHKSDTVEPVVLKMVSASIKAVHASVSKEAGSATASKFPAGADDASTVKAIVAINKQLSLDKLCKAQGLATGVSACSQEKIDALAYALKELDTLEKTVDKANKGLKESEDSRKKAQDAINTVGKANGLNKNEITYADATKAVADKLTVNKNELVKSMGLTIAGPVNKESLIKALGAADKVTVPSSKSAKTLPATPNPATVAAKK